VAVAVVVVVVVVVVTRIRDTLDKANLIAGLTDRVRNVVV